MHEPARRWGALSEGDVQEGFIVIFCVMKRGGGSGPFVWLRVSACVSVCECSYWFTTKQFKKSIDLRGQRLPLMVATAPPTLARSLSRCRSLCSQIQSAPARLPGALPTPVVSMSQSPTLCL